MTPARKLALTALLFGLTAATVVVAAAVDAVWPVFVAWVPLLLVAWVLSRDEPDRVVATDAAEADAAVVEAEERGTAPL